MEFNLGTKYQSKENKNGRSVLMSLFVLIQHIVFITISLSLCILIAIVIPKAFVVSLVFIILGVFAISNVISKSIIKYSIVNTTLFKWLLIAEYLLITIPYTFFLIVTIGANIRVEDLMTNYELSFGKNIHKFFYSIKDGIDVFGINVPTVLFIVIFLFVGFFIFAQLFMIDSEETLYIESEDLTYPSQYLFSLTDYNYKFNGEVDYEYFKTLEIDEFKSLQPKMRYYDIYIYGEEKVYYHVYSYRTVKKGKKIRKVNVAKSDIYEYDETLFE